MDSQVPFKNLDSAGTEVSPELFRVRRRGGPELAESNSALREIHTRPERFELQPVDIRPFDQPIAKAPRDEVSLSDFMAFALTHSVHDIDFALRLSTLGRSLPAHTRLNPLAVEKSPKQLLCPEETSDLFQILKSLQRMTTSALSHWLESRTQLASPLLQSLGFSTDHRLHDAVRAGRTSDAFSVNVLTYNVWGVPRVFGGKLPGRHVRTADLISRSDFDVACFQEMWSRSTSILGKLPSHPYRAHTSNMHGMRGGNGLLTISKHPIVSSEMLEFPITRGVESLAKKGALFTRVEFPNGRLVDFWNVHLLSHTRLLSEEDAKPFRQQQVYQLAEWIEQRSEPGIPVFIPGDFNIDSSSDEYEILSEHLGIDTYGVRNRPELCGSSLSEERRLGHSFNPNRNYWAKNFWASKNLGGPRRLDYVFMKGVAPWQCALSSELCFTGNLSSGKPLSDHFGVATRAMLFD